MSSISHKPSPLQRTYPSFHHSLIGHVEGSCIGCELIKPLIRLIGSAASADVQSPKKVLTEADMTIDG
jgi:hypothetical protein